MGRGSLPQNHGKKNAQKGKTTPSGLFLEGKEERMGLLHAGEEKEGGEGGGGDLSFVVGALEGRER